MKIKLFTRRFFLLALVAGATLLLTNCKKDPDAVGADLIPKDKLPDVLYSDTSSVLSHSQLIDSIRTDENTRNLLGSIYDPVFGNTNASFSAQFRLLNENPEIAENPVIDSIILNLSYSNYYGDTTTPLYLRVYELSEHIYKDSVYFSTSNFQTYGFDYADMYFTPKPGTGYTPEGDTITQPPRLRIDLAKYTNELGNKILSADTAYLVDNENFVKFFKGLYIETDPVSFGGSILYFDLLSTATNLTIYYHGDTANYSLPMVLNTNSARINHFKHDYYTSNNSNFREQVLNKDTSLGQESIFLQAMGGVKSILRFPYVRDWMTNNSIVVNEAKLVLPVAESIDIYRNAPQLGLTQINEDGTTSFLDDELEGEEYFDGTFDSTSMSYNFRITQYIQLLMMGEYKDYGLSLFINSAGADAYRSIIYGPESSISGRNMKLELRYTEVSR